MNKTNAGVAAAIEQLMEPVRLGALELKHRVLMAPLTRSRATWPGLIPNDQMALYYEQRASEGGLIIGEATNILRREPGGTARPVSTRMRKRRVGKRYCAECIQKTL